MRSKFTMEMSICQAENGFSLDELVKKLADALANKAFAEILKMNWQLTQEVLMYQIFNNSSNQQCCPDGHLTLNGGFERRIRTNNWCHSIIGIIGAILCMFFIDNRLVGKLFSFCISA